MADRRALARAGVLLACLALLGCRSSATAPARHETGHYAMGTLLELQLLGPERAALARAESRGLAEVERLEALLSSWREASDVSRLNASAGRGELAVAPELARLLARCVELAHATHGSFDVTVGPLVALWSDAAESGALPSPEALAAARARVGPEQLRVDVAGARVALAAGSRIDLGGVAKGYALDRVREVLGDGVEAALLSFGQSSAWALGAPPGASGWRLLVRAPAGGFAGVLTLRDRALSVSGSLGQWSEIAGRRFGHVLDPRSAWPLERRREALVVSGDATLAEALSKAVLVLGEQEGIALVEAWPGVEALLLDAAGGAWRTSGWDAATSYEPFPDNGGPEAG